MAGIALPLKSHDFSYRFELRSIALEPAVPEVNDLIDRMAETGEIERTKD